MYPRVLERSRAFGRGGRGGPGWKVAAAIFLFTWTLTTHGKYSASGDEPHYLMIAHSIVVDHDMDVGNNYAQDDGRFFGHGGLDMGLHAVPARNGRLRPIHNVGLAVALVPVYAFALQASSLPSESLLKRFRMSRGLFAYSIVSLFLIAVTTFGLLLLGRGIAAETGDARVASVVVLAGGLSPPLLSQSFLVFPEVAAIFVTCLALWMALERPGAGDRAALFATALALGLLPWMHNKFLLYVPGLAAVVAWKRLDLLRRLSGLELGALVLAVVLPIVGLEAWIFREWGTLGGALTTGEVPFSAEMLKSGLPGLFFDRQSGLLAYAPLYWIVPACWWLTGRRTWPLLVPAALLYVPAAAFTIGWWAGFSPAARYIAPLVPICLVVMAGGFRSRAVWRTFLALLCVQGVIDAVVWRAPRTLWPADDVNPALEAVGWLGRAYERLLPPLQTSPSTVWVAVLLMAGGAATAALVSVGRRTPA